VRPAANRGEAIDVETGLPVLTLPGRSDLNWWDLALTAVDLKWPALAASSRRAMAEALVTAAMALLTETKTRPADDDLQAVMVAWTFNATRVNGQPVGPFDHLAEAAAWLVS
jgi:hypothetical protein